MATALVFSPGAVTDVGLVRQKNDDSWHADSKVLAVADGVGGRPAGEIASHLATQVAAAVVHAGGEPIEGLLSANAIVASSSRLNTLFTGMQTTLTVVGLSGSTVRIAHVGDSRAYVLRGRRFTPLTVDHTVVARLVAEGRLTPAQAATDRRRNMIYQSIGRTSELDPWVRSFRVRPGDRLLLCTDGVSHFLPDDKLAAIVVDEADPQRAAESLVRTSLDAGSNDNLTAVVADVHPVVVPDVPPHQLEPEAL